MGIKEDQGLHNFAFTVEMLVGEALAQRNLQRAERSAFFPVARFAGQLAQLLNTGNRIVTVNVGKLYHDIIALLARGPAEGDKRNRYIRHLVALPLFGRQMTAQEAATIYFERTLDRPLFLHPPWKFQSAHKLFLSLCRRGQDLIWKTARLVRVKGGVANRLASRPQGFTVVSKRLADLKTRHGHRISSGRPASSTRIEHGPLFLVFADGGVEVAEEMSVWEAIRCAPSELRVLAKPEFDDFSSIVIKAVEAAHVAYGVKVALGLSPLDWGDLSTNTAVKARTFLSRVRRSAKKMGRTPDNLGVWRSVWTERQVPGFSSADEFRRSPLGRALRASKSAAIVDNGASWVESEAQKPISEMLASRDVTDLIASYAQAGAFDAYDLWFITKLIQGKTMDRLARSPKTRARFGRAEIPASYQSEIQERLRRN